MPKKTLLEVVQYVSNKINSDQVTSFADASIEVDDIRSICLEVLEDIISRNEWEFLRDHPMQLTAGNDEISLAIPTNVNKVQTVRYRYTNGGVQEGFRTLKYMRPTEFMCRLQQNNPAEPDTATVLVNGVELYPKTNVDPRFWTSFDEKNVYIDSYNAVENPAGVIPGDSAILAIVYLDFTGSDVETWVAPIPEQVFPYWLQEAAAEASVALRQSENQREERRARRSYTQSIKREPVTQRDEGTNEVNYGR